MSDLIERGDAIKALYKYSFVSKDIIEREINAIPSADRPKSVDLTNVYQTAYDNGYARGKADRPRGEWIDAEIPLESGGSMPIQVCNLCKTFYPLAYTGGGHRFCPNCGADMREREGE